MMRLMTRRLAALLTILLLALSAPAALAQNQGGGGGGGAFGPLPPAAPEPTATPTPDPAVEAQEGTDRTLLFLIGGGLVVLFVVITRVITSDARKALRAQGKDAAPLPRDQGPHRHARQSKAKARAKTKAQRRARRQNR
jgi:hypothetical protein